MYSFEGLLSFIGCAETRNEIDTIRWDALLARDGGKITEVQYELILCLTAKVIGEKRSGVNAYKG